ncbi:hypothetical protein [Candidatus Nitrospira allomarina]|uniref:Uracil-DNA glycosylase-like domain-containing protein n=1 Tax=Candidatus Nitrospira allomarina TaxID=3020900 RepID=A0AA96JS18_9BACT|nr:hypothetical protein [Candidatus Nitrospira allomarina]WNM57733.1 hypothetical protein PP769_17445 [Candidatus Nitrospira allomarina]
MRRFDPWVGTKYRYEGFNGLKVLILGESHYGDAGTETAELTSEVVKEWGQEKRSRFFTVTQKLIQGTASGERVLAQDRKEFWEQVAFYNYIQEFVGAGPRQRPAQEMWERSAAAFNDTLGELEPNVLVVLGYELQSNLPKVPLDLVVCNVKHPSAGGFRYSDWQQAIQAALRIAMGKTPNKVL